MNKLIDLTSYPVKRVINTLLKDRSSGQNIILATEAYETLGFKTQITEKLLRSDSLSSLQPRVLKSIEEKTQRTKKKAEVFTPSWICNKMNNHCDAEWFGRENVFNTENGNDWVVNEQKIEFPEGKSWKDYIDSKRLEITCGEAPYLVSRYDAVTGEIIPLHKRIGILDRKLRVINENVHTQRTWDQWVFRAFESVYGFEYQGDNLLIARVNLFETFCEYTRERWNKEPNITAMKKIATIISWNIWQMDGIQGVIPYTGEILDMRDEVERNQISVFDNPLFSNGSEKEYGFESSECVECKIYDWRNNEVINYKKMKEA